MSTVDERVEEMIEDFVERGLNLAEVVIGRASVHVDKLRRDRDQTAEDRRSESLRGTPLDPQGPLVRGGDGGINLERDGESFDVPVNAHSMRPASGGVEVIGPSFGGLQSRSRALGFAAWLVHIADRDDPSHVDFFAMIDQLDALDA